jgi:transposase
MASTEKRMEAKQLYILKAMTCTAIAQALQVDPKTIYRWRSEDKEKGETFDWDFQRQLHLTSNGEIAAKFQKSIAIMIDGIEKDPTLLINPKTADALAKILKARDRIDTRSQYLSTIMDFIRITDQWLSEHQPELKVKIEPYWDAILERLTKYATQKGLF